MPRGRHRHSPPLHRLLPPSAIAGVSLVCAFGPWVFSEPAVLRVVAACAAATAAVGAAVMRRWDAQAGKQVADLARARASDEWRHEERIAELETDLDESRELRVKLEHKLRAKRAELAGLRNEHAALLRRYATAETERASALEGRRLLEIEATAPAPALPPAPVEADEDASIDVKDEAEAVAAPAETDVETETEAESEAEADAVEEEPAAPAVFSPEGSKLFLRAKAALVRFDGDREAVPPPNDDSAKDEPAPADPETAPVAAESGGTQAEAAQEDEAQGKPEAVDEHEHAAATPTAAKPAKSAQPSGHYTVPTAVAVVPAAPVRRPLVEGGFDFFGTQKGSSSAALEAVQNEDLADVVGQEALAVHKAESEAQFKPADERSRGVGQVIDLTAHDETEQIDVQGLKTEVQRLRSAAS
jgi:hypothetical protein